MIDRTLLPSTSMQSATCSTNSNEEEDEASTKPLCYDQQTNTLPEYTNQCIHRVSLIIFITDVGLPIYMNANSYIICDI